MKQGLLVFFAMCVLTIAMVPRDRRAVNTEEQEMTTVKQNETLCAAETPCGWVVYKNSVKIIKLNITNTYCICSDDQKCVEDELDTDISAYVYRCRDPASLTTTTDSSTSDS